MKKKNKRLRKSRQYDEVLSAAIRIAGKPVNYKQVAAQVPYMNPKDVAIILDLLVRDRKLKKTEDHKYVYQKSRDEITGILDFNNRGDAYLVVENVDKDIKIRQGNTLDAFNGDEVRVRLTFDRNSGKKQAYVTEILNRSRTKFVGTYTLEGNTSFVIPDSNSIHADFYIPAERRKNAQHGDKVLVKLRDWPAKAKNPYGKIVEVFGKSGTNTAEMHAIVAEFGFDTSFSDDILAAANRFPKEISDKEIAKRVDFRETTTFTIDPADAKDFDDALSFKDLGNGLYEIGIHIADVSHYVTPKDKIDTEALRRATSVYLVDRTIPMLPERLSNELCSLRPKEESLCFAVIFQMDNKGVIKKYDFAKTVIFSDRRFSYEEAQQVMETGKGDFSEELQTMNSIAKVVRERRYKDGAINFETTEFRFELDSNGSPISVIPKIRKDAHKMIEEYMLLANKYVAMHLYTKNKKMPLPYRVHEDPSPEKLAEFAATAAEFGFKIDINDLGKLSQSINAMIKKIEGTAEGDILQPLAIRSMEKAYYTSEKIGHFGLGFDHYAHFTSPIRRYPDLITHRMLQDYLIKQKSFNYSEVEKMASHSSKQEQKATQAERASIKYKQVEFLSRFKGDEFEGIISGVTEWGIFVEIIENKCEGMVRISDMRGDSYDYFPKKKMVMGRRTKKTYTLGEKVWIKVKNTNLTKRTIDFEILER